MSASGPGPAEGFYEPGAEPLQPQSFVAEADVVSSLVGRTIVRVEHEEDERGEGGDVADLHLDDGRVIRFAGWGHDYWGLAVYEVNIGDAGAHDATSVEAGQDSGAMALENEA